MTSAIRRKPEIVKIVKRKIAPPIEKRKLQVPVLVLGEAVPAFTEPAKAEVLVPPGTLTADQVVIDESRFGVDPQEADPFYAWATDLPEIAVAIDQGYLDPYLQRLGAMILARTMAINATIESQNIAIAPLTEETSQHVGLQFDSDGYVMNSPNWRYLRGGMKVYVRVPRGRRSEIAHAVVVKVNPTRIKVKWVGRAKTGTTSRMWADGAIVGIPPQWLTCHFDTPIGSI